MISLIAPMRDVSRELVRFGARLLRGRRRRHGPHAGDRGADLPRQAAPALRWSVTATVGQPWDDPVKSPARPPGATHGRPHPAENATSAEAPPRRLFSDPQSRPHKVAEITPPGLPIHSRPVSPARRRWALAVHRHGSHLALLPGSRLSRLRRPSPGGRASRMVRPPTGSPSSDGNA